MILNSSGNDSDISSHSSTVRESLIPEGTSQFFLLSNFLDTDSSDLPFFVVLLSIVLQRMNIYCTQQNALGKKGLQHEPNQDNLPKESGFSLVWFPSNFNLNSNMLNSFDVKPTYVENAE